MSVTVKYFASLRETMGRGEDTVGYAVGLTVADVWARVTEGGSVAEGTLTSVNFEYVEFDHVVSDGDEVAFFPPVTGG